MCFPGFWSTDVTCVAEACEGYRACKIMPRGNHPDCIQCCTQTRVDGSIRIGVDNHEWQNYCHHGAIEKPKLGLEIEPVPAETVASWRGRGVELSNQASVDRCDCEEIHVLLEADCGHQLVLGKRVVDEEAACMEHRVRMDGVWATADISRFTTNNCCLPQLQSPNLCGSWRNPLIRSLKRPCSQRSPCIVTTTSTSLFYYGRPPQCPEDNRKQGFATAKALACKLEAPEKRQVCDDVLVHELILKTIGNRKGDCA